MRAPLSFWRAIPGLSTAHRVADDLADTALSVPHGSRVRLLSNAQLGRQIAQLTRNTPIAGTSTHLVSTGLA
eukprot:2321186-Rhodomonas_salina.1